VRLRDGGTRGGDRVRCSILGFSSALGGCEIVLLVVAASALCLIVRVRVGGVAGVRCVPVRGLGDRRQSVERRGER
jgi:hypothetical protein